jgi:hypothetical protein
MISLKFTFAENKKLIIEIRTLKETYIFQF